MDNTPTLNVQYSKNISNKICIQFVQSYSIQYLTCPEDINDFTDGLYQWSVTLNARMWPPIESGAPKRFLGLPEIVWWGILSGCLIVFFILVFLTFLFCWFLPRRRQKKFDLSQNSAVTRDSTGLSTANSTGVIFPHSAIGVKPWTNLLTNSSSVCNSVQASQYNSPPIHSLTSSSMYRHQYMLNYQQFPSSSSCGVNSNASSFDDCSFQNIPETHKSMWVLNPLYASTSAFSECENYRTRSLPAWGRIKQRPVTTDDIANLYVKMNLSKKRRNRMCRDEAAIIALCRSRSQNLSGIPFEHEGVVVYDERTEL
ncbi:uncharacterized protein LOC116345082 [Contarinia nasturtii]|uniref:uncharacterized protein LOC116345082 n=1 Tax=Contarinia nasturtii TaxID=265458 RepID=UPI0012D39461|nr:uncharacterized protein LOC116345082 [Contarinia nasturtii]